MSRVLPSRLDANIGMTDFTTLRLKCFLVRNFLGARILVQEFTRLSRYFSSHPLLFISKDEITVHSGNVTHDVIIDEL